MTRRGAPPGGGGPPATRRDSGDGELQHRADPDHRPLAPRAPPPPDEETGLGWGGGGQGGWGRKEKNLSCGIRTGSARRRLAGVATEMETDVDVGQTGLFLDVGGGGRTVLQRSPSEGHGDLMGSFWHPAGGKQKCSPWMRTGTVVWTLLRHQKTLRAL